MEELKLAIFVRICRSLILALANRIVVFPKTGRCPYLRLANENCALHEICYGERGEAILALLRGR